MFLKSLRHKSSTNFGPKPFTSQTMILFVKKLKSDIKEKKKSAKSRCPMVAFSFDEININEKLKIH